MVDKIQSFTDLVAWKKAHRLALLVYRCTEDFPNNEQFGLTQQMRRAAVSIPSNIAEGFSRKTTKDKLQFYAVAHGSLSEIQTQSLLAKDLGYLEAKCFDFLAELSVETSKLINGLRKSLMLTKPPA